MDEYDYTCLRVAVITGDCFAIKSAIKPGMDINYNFGVLLRDAVRNNYLDVVQCLKELKADFGIADGMAVREATKNGRSEILFYLLDNGAAFRTEIVDLAIKHGKTDILKELKARGYNLQPTSTEPIHSAILMDYTETVLFLMRHVAITDETIFNTVMGMMSNTKTTETRH